MSLGADGSGPKCSRIQSRCTAAKNSAEPFAINGTRSRPPPAELKALNGLVSTNPLFVVAASGQQPSARIKGRFAKPLAHFRPTLPGPTVVGFEKCAPIACFYEGPGQV